MAITATAQPPLSDLSWDETIVPTLRQRLESESRAISKRMSTISIGSGEDGTLSYPQKTRMRPSVGVNGKAGGRVTPTSMNNERPSGIPRPSLNYSRPSIGSASVVASQGTDGANMKRNVQPRVRTYSQPFKPDATRVSKVTGSNAQTDASSSRTPNALPTPVSSRSSSPIFSPSQAGDACSAKTSASKRADQNMQNQTLQAPDEFDGQGRWDVDEDIFDASYSSIRVPQQVKQNGILHEAPPFSVNSSFASDIDERPSLEERPYEHWYRGDLSRNGGVGELRIGNRLEMLEIASYGHKLRDVRNDTFSRQRRRAQSIGHRESVIFAEESDGPATPMVLDEAPLTDMEVDTELETDREHSFAVEDELSPLERPKRTNNGTTTVPPTPKHRQVTQIPHVTPRMAQRTASEPLHAKNLSSSTTSSMTPSRTRPAAHANGAKVPKSESQPLTSTPAHKRGRVKSPAATPSSKRPRPSAAQQNRSKSSGAAERLRPSDLSEYPAVPDFESMADAIPSWTQPKKAGNWDDVVLPAVARKMGLEDQYEEADGSPKAPRPPSEEVAPPQPGTFAFDASKRRERYDPATGKHITMEQLDRAEKIEEESETMPTETTNALSDARMFKRYSTLMRPNGGAPASADDSGFKQNVRRYSPTSSPAPFEQCKTATPTKPEPVQEMTIEEEKHSGCCGCVIM